MGAVKRDREKEGEREKADMYCGCLMTGREKKKTGREAGEMVRERCSDRMRKTLSEEKCERVLGGKRDSVTSKGACGC